MEQTLVLKRRLRPNLVLPELLSSLQRRLLFWRHTPSLRWDGMTLLVLAGLIYTFVLLFSGKLGLIFWFALGTFGLDLHDNALPIFARVRIRGDRITTGKLLGERYSLAEIQSYCTSQTGLSGHLVRFDFSEKYWPHRFAFVVDKEDAPTLSEHLKARGIADVAVAAEPVALEA